MHTAQMSAYYAEPAPMTEAPGAFAGLPDGAPSRRRIVSGLVIHPDLTELSVPADLGKVHVDR